MSYVPQNDAAFKEVLAILNENWKHVAPNIRAQQAGIIFSLAMHFDEIRRLMDMSDDEIDTSDIPEITDWSGSVRGKFYRGPK